MTSSEKPYILTALRTPCRRKVLPQTPFQRLPTLFFLQGVPPYKQNSSVFSFKGVPLAEKTELKVLGREFEVTPRSAGRCPKGRGARRRQREPFSRKVCPSNKCKPSIGVSNITSSVDAFYIERSRSIFSASSLR